MNKPRASIFDGDADDIDVSAFAPKTASDPAAPPAEEVRAIAEAANFPSREVVKRPPVAPAAMAAPAPVPVQTPPAKREPRRHRTGRTAQFNARTTPETVEAFYAIADQQGWLVGETVEHALAALQRELKEQGRGAKPASS
ncbi:stability/partitioning determinant [Methylobacterium sp. E-065]|uniref:stability/partitioning determinant n=1 Tax=Methylobacterium sp. E-065 TaxID=2836583 RepID=UPI001FB8D658|nr:stability/partitioning determinant [Methylobacterium sp. E-065]MCJ2015874.1 stability/partitioning determinant [Methylobacterium sp. E-065]